MSSSIRLERLRLRSFRGATREVPIDFDSSKQVTMVFGENGTGKSTVVDALTFLCDQSIGSLDDRAGAKDEKYLVSVGSNRNDLLVEVKTTVGTWTATFSGSKIQVSPSHGYPRLKVLRRPQLSRFIEAEPKRRFEELRQFISTPGVERSEEGLREAERSVGAHVQTLARDLTQATKHLESLWEEEGRKGTGAESWAKEIAQQDALRLNSENDAIKTVDRLVATFSSAIKGLALAVEQEERARVELQKAVIAQQQEEQKAVGHSGDLLRLLRSALDYVRKQTTLANCPVCDQTVERDALEAQLGKRVSSFGELAQAVETVEGRKKSLEGAEARIGDSLQRVAEALQEIRQYLVQGQLPAALVPLYPSHDATNVDDAKLPVLDRLEAAKRILDGLQKSESVRKAQADTNVKAINLRNAVSLQLRTLHEHEQDLAKSDALAKRLRRAREVVEEERKAFVANILKTISDDVVALYGRLHPNEPLGNISLMLDPRYQGSLLLKGEFVGEKDVPPQAYFSESHLDTLGISIFLAFAKRFSPPGTLVVLDDVLTSVDSSHLDRFIDLVDSEAGNYGHVVITTHYRPWRERYRMHQAAGSKLHFIELKEWSPDRGLLPDTCIPAIKELEGWLEPKTYDRQVVASKGGILLESILDQLSLLYRVRLPRKPAHDYTLGEFLDGFPKKHRSLLRAEHLDPAGAVVTTTALGPIIDYLDDMAWVRNQVGCHFSLSGQTVTDKEVRAFGEKVVELGIALTCADGGDFPRQNRSGSYYESRRGRCRLYPLQMP